MARMIQFAATVALILTLTACGGDEDDEPKGTSLPTSSEASVLSERTFTFVNGTVFHAALSDQEVHLVFGDLGGGEGPYTLRAGDEVAGGTAGLGSCLLKVEASTFPAGEGPQEGDTIHLDPCMLDAGQLRAENTDTGITARSTDSASFDPYAIGNTWAYIQTYDGPGCRDHDTTMHYTYTVTGRRMYRGRDAVEIAGVIIEDGEEYPFTLLIDARTGGTMAITSEHGRYTSEGTLERKVTTEEYDPPRNELPLPLEVGKAWTEAYQDDAGSREYTDPQTGETVTETIVKTVTSRYTVASFEAVTTPADTFMAFRIENTETREGRHDTSTSTYTIYYEPITRLFVKIADSWMTSDGQCDSETLLASYEY